MPLEGGQLVEQGAHGAQGGVRGPALPEGGRVGPQEQVHVQQHQVQVQLRGTLLQAPHQLPQALQHPIVVIVQEKATLPGFGESGPIALPAR